MSNKDQDGWIQLNSFESQWIKLRKFKAKKKLIEASIQLIQILVTTQHAQIQ